jgi:hypothetical protein
MTDDRASFVARVICLYLEDPDTPQVPSSADWDIAHDLHNRGITLDTVRLAFRLASVRRRLRPPAEPLPPIRSLAYFRAVALNLTPDERNPTYAEYVNDLYSRLNESLPASNHSAQNRGEQPASRGSS